MPNVVFISSHDPLLMYKAKRPAITFATGILLAAAVLLAACTSPAIHRAGVQQPNAGEKARTETAMTAPSGKENPMADETSDWHLPTDPLNATYRIGEKSFSLQNGRSEIFPFPGSSSAVRTSVVGDIVEGDIDGDGDDDAVLLLVHEPGGSGTFYYVAAAENIGGRYRGSDAFLLGDRISVDTIRIRKTIIEVEWKNRRPGEPMSTLPSVEENLKLRVETRRLNKISFP